MSRGERRRGVGRVGRGESARWDDNIDNIVTASGLWSYCPTSGSISLNAPACAERRGLQCFSGSGLSR